MRPIPRKFLPNIITVYNIHRDTSTGVLSYFRTFIELTRIVSKASSINSDTTGWTRVMVSNLLIDRSASRAYGRDSTGEMSTKTYLQPSEWGLLQPEAKAAHWTLNEGDLVVDGECQIDPETQELGVLLAASPLTIKGVAPIFDRPGSVHHWEVALV